MRKRKTRRNRWILIGLIFAGMAGYGIVTFNAIRRQAIVDEARPADCIVVLGAAQYNGRPSPVLKARLDHTLELFDEKMAPRIITTGGYGGDRKFSEAGVGKEYLVKHGVPPDAVEADSHGDTTLESVRSVKPRLALDQAKSCIVVSDGFHLFRCKALFAHEGLVAYTSPAPDSPIESSATSRFWHSLREVFVLSLIHI